MRRRPFFDRPGRPAGSVPLLKPGRKHGLEDPFVRSFGIVVEIFERADHRVQLYKPDRKRIEFGIGIVERFGDRATVR